MKKRKFVKMFSLGAALFLLLLVASSLIIGAIIYFNIDFEADEALFRRARTWNSTAFYVNENCGTCDEAYKPKKIETSGSIKKDFYSVDEISNYLTEGFVAVEDRIFYEHNGVDIRRTVAAALNYITRRQRVFGASTITQQVIKNISGDNEFKLTRKLSEIIRAYHIEKHFTKDEIMEVYLNVIPMSENVYGVGSAAKAYFNKEPSELTAEEAATLIGITNAPTAYNPYNNYDACLKKRNTVLYVMNSVGIIDDEEYRSAKSTPISVIPREAREDRFDSWFVEVVIDEVSSDMAKKYNISDAAARMMLLGGGYSVYTTMDERVQGMLENYFEDTSNFSYEIKRGLNYSMVVADCDNGNLVGVIGRVGKKEGNRLLNHASVLHTPASVQKPLALYAPLIEEGVISWSSVFDDVPVNFYGQDGDYREYPHNSPDVYDGLTTVKDAVKKSKNTIAMRLCNIRTPKKVFAYMKDVLGFDTLVEKEKLSDGRVITDIATAPMALGQLCHGVSLMKLTECYGTFSSEGVLRKMRSYISVLDYEGNIIIENEAEEKRIFKESTARIMNQLLKNVTDDGTARSVTLGELVDTAGKTGTSAGNKDKLFIGYTPYYTAGIWSGYDNSQDGIYSVQPSHLQIWDEVMHRLHADIIDSGDSLRSFSTEGLEYLPYCMDSGELYSSVCVRDVRGSRLEYGYFSKDNRPSVRCQRHIECLYDTESKGIADIACPKKNIVVVSLIKVDNRSFPKEIYVTDAEYVYRDIKSYQEMNRDGDLPYFYSTLTEEEYAGISKRKRQFNAACPIHS